MKNVDAATLVTLRRLLLGILLFGLVGTGAELLLIGHHEDIWQRIPLAVLVAAILTSFGILLTPSTSVATIQLFRGAMVLLMLSGATGSVLHYRANREFKLEMDPSLRGFPLFWSVVRAKAPPALAPGNLALLGLLGLALAFRIDVSTPSRNS